MILMSTNNIQFLDKIRTIPQLFVFLNYQKNFVGSQKRVFESYKVNESSRFSLDWLQSPVTKYFSHNPV